MKTKWEMIEWAIRTDNKEVIESVIKSGFNIKHNNNAALNLALLLNKWSLVKYLLKRGASVISIDDYIKRRRQRRDGKLSVKDYIQQLKKENQPIE